MLHCRNNGFKKHLTRYKTRLIDKLIECHGSERVFLNAVVSSVQVARAGPILIDILAGASKVARGIHAQQRKEISRSRQRTPHRGVLIVLSVERANPIARLGKALGEIRKACGQV
jgi:hypothetical protein